MGAMQKLSHIRGASSRMLKNLPRPSEARQGRPDRSEGQEIGEAVEMQLKRTLKPRQGGWPQEGRTENEGRPHSGRSFDLLPQRAMALTSCTPRRGDAQTLPEKDQKRPLELGHSRGFAHGRR